MAAVDTFAGDTVSFVSLSGFVDKYEPMSFAIETYAEMSFIVILHNLTIGLNLFYTVDGVI